MCTPYTNYAMNINDKDWISHYSKRNKTNMVRKIRVKPNFGFKTPCLLIVC